MALIDEEGKQAGVVETYRALDMARERNLDLVEVNPKAWPPICRIMDYGKYLYKKSKLEREERKKQQRHDIKGVRLGIKTSPHDSQTKAAKTDTFLAKGHKVRIELVLKRRDSRMRGFAKGQIDLFLKFITHPFKVEQELKQLPRGLTMIISPERKQRSQKEDSEEIHPQNETKNQKIDTKTL